MIFKAKFNKKALKIGAGALFLLFVIVGTKIPLTYSRYFDEESALSNIFESVVLDLGLRTTEDASEYSHTVEIGDTEEFEIFVQKLGSSAFAYSQKVENVKENDLCSTLNLKVWYYWYDTGGGTHDDIKYDGALADFELNQSGDDDDLQLPNSNEYYSNSTYSQNEHWFHYQIELPDDHDGDSEESCEFDMRFRGWLEGFWDEEFLKNTVDIEPTLTDTL